MKRVIWILFLNSLIIVVASQCTLPLSDGTWISTSRGTWTVASSGAEIQNFQAELTISLTTTTLECVATGSESNQYILKSNFELFFQLFIDVYTCIEIIPTDQAPYSYIYYIVTATDATTGEQFTSDQNAACSNSGYQTGANLNILTQSDTVANATINFPDIILGNYSLVYEDKDSAQEADWQMDSCNDTKLMSFTHASSTNRVGFTASNAPNLLQCLYSLTEGSNTYVFMYNNGTQDGSASFSYTCWVFASSGSDVVATAFPNTCQETQTATSVIYGGEKFTFTPYYTCPLNQTNEDEGFPGWLIAIIVIAILLLIAIAVIIFVYCYMRKHKEDEEKGILKRRQPSPDSIRGLSIEDEKKKAQEEANITSYRSGDADNNKLTGRKKDRENTRNLIEISREKDQELQDPQPTEKKVKHEGTVIPKEVVKQKQSKKEKELEDKKREEEERKKETERKKQEEALRNMIEPTGKQAIPPTTPKPEDDKTLLRIKKERERKEKEKEEKKKLEEQRKKGALRKEQKEIKPEEKVHRHVRETSSSEYETDEEDQEERKQRLIEKRKRLTAASYEPIDGMVGDASIIGRKKLRKHRQFEDGGDTAGKLMSREENEKQNDERRASKRRLKKMAKRKVKGHEYAMTSDSETDTKGRKRRRAGDTRGVMAPHIDKYYHKKDIEQELDNIHYWSEPEEAAPFEDALATPKIGVNPDQKIDSGVENEVVSPSKMDINIEDEPDDSDHIRVGPNDDLPEGYEFDKDGNVVRKIDGKIALTKSEVEKRRKFGHVFSLPRLIRNEDGRPLGGYKDDEFGPTAEWDWGVPDEVKETETEQKQSEVPPRTVGFTMKEDLSTVPASPLNEVDSNQRKGRQLGSADRKLLRERLFEQQQQQRAKSEQPTSVPIYFSGSKGVKDSAFIANSQIEKQDPESIQRSQSVKVGGKTNNMIVRSDTFDDGRMRNGKGHPPGSGLRRGKLRASWTAPSGGIPEETEIPDTQMPSRNIGSMDEFILVGGSVNRMVPPNTLDSELPVKFCPRAFPSSRERSNISDVNMRTAPDSPEAIPDSKLRRYAGEFLTDKRFFDQYIETEKLPTNAAVETRELANEGLDYIHDRALFWRSKEPEPLRPPPSDLGIRLMRMNTFYTTVDSGLDSRMSTMTSRPKSASDANEHVASSRLSQREVTMEPLQERNQNQYQRHLHGRNVTPAESENKSGVQRVKVKPGNED